MRKLMMWLALAAVILVSSTAFASADTTVQSQSAFGTIARGTTVCVGNLVPTTADGVQIFGFTNGNPSLTWQVLTVSSNSAPAVVFETTAVRRSYGPAGAGQFSLPGVCGQEC
jgi:hypothetical protein